MQPQMIALETKRGRGLSVATHMRRQGFDEHEINQRMAQAFARGSYRPSDRAALLLDAAPILTPFADDAIAAD